MNRSKLTEKEGLYLDLFLFGYYTGGSTISELASLKTSSIKEENLYCKRNASENTAVIPLCPEALYIINKYREMCFDNYLLPILTHKQTTGKQQLGRIKRVAELTNQTLRKVSKILNVKNEITMGMTKRILLNTYFQAVYLMKSSRNIWDVQLKRFPVTLKKCTNVVYELHTSK